jgi:hypothetical protein
MNTQFKIQSAIKKKAKLRLGIGGVSGSGKTYSALLLASGIVPWDKIVVIDTENESANLYADLGDYKVLALGPDYTPERYIEAITACEQQGFEVIIIDSISHEWEGIGGCLEIVSRLGGRYTDWKDVTPRHRKLIEKILQSPIHIIVTMRKKTDYDYSKDEQKGKMIVEKIGLKDVQREGMDYEMTVQLDIDLKHYATASKDRSRLFMDKPPFMITPDTGKQLKQWLESESKPICARCDTKLNLKTEITKTQAQKTEKEYNMPLCKKCELVAKKYKKEQNNLNDKIEKELEKDEKQAKFEKSLEDIKHKNKQKEHAKKVKGAKELFGK